MAKKEQKSDLPRMAPTAFDAAFGLYETLGLIEKQLPIGEPASAEQIATAESRLGGALPTVLRECLVLHDGLGSDILRGGNSFPVAPTAYLAGVGLFDHTLADHLRDAEDEGVAVSKPEGRTYDVRSLLPRETLFPFGSTSSGDVYFLDLQARTAYGIPVFLFHHDALCECTLVASCLPSFVAQVIVDAARRSFAKDPVPKILQRSKALANAARPRWKKVVAARTAQPARALSIAKTITAPSWVAGDDVKSLSLLPDGKRVVSRSDDGVIHVWDMATGVPLLTLASPDWSADLCAVSRDGSTLLALVRGREEAHLRTWATGTGKDLRTPIDCVDVVRDNDPDQCACAVSLDARYAALAAAKQVVVYDLRKGAPIARMKAGALGEERRLAFSPSGDALLYADRTRSELWAVPSGESVWKTDASSVPPTPIFLKDGKTVVTGCYRLELRDARTGAIVKELETGYAIEAMSVDPGESVVATASLLNELDLFDLSTGKRVAALPKPKKDLFFNAVVALGDRKSVLINGAQASRIARVVVSEGKDLGGSPGHATAIRTVAVSPSGARLATATPSEGLWLWDLALATGTPIPTGPVFQVVFVDESRCLLDRGDSKLALYDVDAKRKIRQYAAEPAEVVVLGGGATFAARRHEDVTIFQTQSGKEVASWKERFQVTAMAATEDGRTLVLSGDRGLTTRDVASGKASVEGLGGRGEYSAVAVTQGGELVLLGGEDVPLKLLSLADGKELGVRTSIDVRIIAFVPGRDRALAACGDTRLRVLGLPGLEDIAVLELWPAGDRCEAMKLMPGGKQAAIATARGALHLLDLEGA
jgi:WD40 repeat protein